MPNKEFDREAIEKIAQKIEDAWNAGDGDAFAEPFSEEAEYTVWNGMFSKGREAIAQGHNRIFSTFYKGSQIRSELEWLRFLTADVAVAQLKSVMVKDPMKVMSKIPVNRERPMTKPLAVLRKQDGIWKIEVFQNTPVIEIQEASE